MATKISGSMQVSPQDVMSESSIQMAELGAVGRTNDGRTFRYVKAGAVALVPGKLQQSSATVANHQNVTVYAAAAIAATTVTATLGATAATLNQYAGGLMIVNDETGQGYSYKIKGNNAVDASGVITITLEDPLIVALDTTSQISLVANPYNGVIVNPTTPTGVPVGVAVYPITATYYGWIQVRGLCSLLNDSNTAVGLGLAPSQSVAGAVKTQAATLNCLGYAYQAMVDTEYNIASININ